MDEQSTADEQVLHVVLPTAARSKAQPQRGAALSTTGDTGPISAARVTFIAHGGTTWVLASMPRRFTPSGAGYGSGAIELGLGMTVKVADGNYRAVAPFVLARLEHLGVLGVKEANELEAYREPKIKNHAGRVVGEIHNLLS